LRRFDERRSQGVELGAVYRTDAARFLLGDKFGQSPFFQSI
jgi:hypothetical protein